MSNNKKGKGTGKGKGKRGASKCIRKLQSSNLTIEFNANGEPIGDNVAAFTSWVGAEFKHRIPYNKTATQVDKSLYEELWNYTKASWKIPNDLAKRTTLMNGKVGMKNFRHYLRKTYAIPGLNPFIVYDYLDQSLWSSFVGQLSNTKFQEKSIKAKEASKHNTDPAHVGRGGYAGRESELATIWKDLQDSNSHLKNVTDPEAIRYLVGRATLNAETEKWELGGEQKGVNKLKKSSRPGSKKRKKQSQGAKLMDVESSGTCDSSSTFRSSFDDISEVESVQPCDIICPYDPDIIFGKGRVHPTSGSLHGRAMTEGFIRIQVDKVEEKYSNYPVPTETRSDEFEKMGQTKNCFIQWPRKSIKLLTTDSPRPSKTAIESFRPSTSTDYMPEIEATLDDQHQTTLIDESNDLGKYAALLRDNEAFEDLVGNLSHNASGHIQMYHTFEMHTKPISIPLHTEPVTSSKSEKNKNEAKKKKEAEKKRKEAENRQKLLIKNLLGKARSRPESIRGFAQQLAAICGETYSFTISSPIGMYKEPFHETIEIGAALELCANGWIDICIVHWFSMYLHETGRHNNLGSTAYLNPHHISSSLVSDNRQFVINHIREVIYFHKDKQWYFAPQHVGDYYSERGHWILFLLQHNPMTKCWKGRIFDSNRCDKKLSDYEFTDLFGESIAKHVSWEMIDCRQQSGNWECGYCVMMLMYEFVITNREHLLLPTSGRVRQVEIDELVERTMSCFLSTLGAVPG